MSQNIYFNFLFCFVNCFNKIFIDSSASVRMNSFMCESLLGKYFIRQSEFNSTVPNVLNLCHTLYFVLKNQILCGLCVFKLQNELSV